MWYISLYWLRAWITFYKFFTAAGIYTLGKSLIKSYMVALKLIFDGEWVVWRKCCWLFCFVFWVLFCLFFGWAWCFWGAAFEQIPPFFTVHVVAMETFRFYKCRQEYGIGLSVRGHESRVQSRCVVTLFIEVILQ